MTSTELLDWLEQEQAPVIAFDTNAIFGGGSMSQFVDLCDMLNRIDELRRRLRPSRTIRKVLSAAVYMEKVHDMRRRYGESFDPSYVGNFLAAKEIEVISFEREDAEYAARLIGQRYPGRAEWHRFKRQRCLDCLGLGELAEEVRGTGQNCGATTDWLVAGHANRRGHLLVTNDRDPEFRGVARKCTIDVMCAAAGELLDRLQHGGGGNGAGRG